MMKLAVPNKKLPSIQGSSKMKPIKESKIKGKNRSRSDRDSRICRKKMSKVIISRFCILQIVEENMSMLKRNMKDINTELLELKNNRYKNVLDGINR